MVIATADELVTVQLATNELDANELDANELVRMEHVAIASRANEPRANPLSKYAKSNPKQKPPALRIPNTTFLKISTKKIAKVSLKDSGKLVFIYDSQNIQYLKLCIKEKISGYLNSFFAK